MREDEGRTHEQPVRLPVVPIYPILSYPIPFPFLSYPILSYPILYKLKSHGFCETSVNRGYRILRKR